MKKDFTVKGSKHISRCGHTL